MQRATQREETRQRIVDAAVECFAALGFRGASTREIARRAGANQGLITYHFGTKEALWRAAVTQIFDAMRAHLERERGGLPDGDPRERLRHTIRAYVRFAAERPELLCLMIEEGKTDDARMTWLVDNHLRPIVDSVMVDDMPELDDTQRAHAYYALVGAGSVMFAVAPECRRLMGIDPRREAVVEAHADFVARMLVP
ncbi:MAG: TetR/AcrR family transcriptional regulator [Myxococcota bacterium]